MTQTLNLEPPKRTKIGANLRFLRHYTEDRRREDVARFVGVSEAEVKRWETSEAIPTIEQAYKIADYFNLAPASLLEVDLLEMHTQAKLMRMNWKNGVIAELTEVPDKMKTIYNLRQKLENQEEIIRQQKERIKELKDALKIKKYIKKIFELQGEDDF